MSSQTFRAPDSLLPDEIEVRSLYQRLLDCWNKRLISPSCLRKGAGLWRIALFQRACRKYRQIA